MLRDCPYHHQTNKVLLHTFIEELDPYTKILLDLAVGTQALEKTYDEFYTLLNYISQGNPKWNAYVSRSKPRKGALVLESDQLIAIAT